MLTFEYMASFKKKVYTDPVICMHNNDVEKDWYIFFRYKHEGKVYKFKRREGINRIKDLQERLSVIEDLQHELKYDLKNGWNPILDPKREINYNPYLLPSTQEKTIVKKSRTSKKQKHLERVSFYYNK